MSSLGESEVERFNSSSSQPSVLVGNLRKYRIALPPTKTEQELIASHLADIDALIAGLERLIAKKRDIKQATMQQLLTGQTRLPGFSGEWEVKQLGEIARLYQPQTISQGEFRDYGYPVFGANGVVGMYEKFNHETPQITISCRGNCGTVNRTSGPAWITGNAMVVNLDGASDIDKDFVYYALTFSDLSVLVTGSGIPQIVRDPLSGFAIELPKNVAEQTAIATVLSDMDADLSALEARLAKTRAIKQGMMQELLTGRTRLVGNT
jgi:type I restriction enzyme S subunit